MSTPTPDPVRATIAVPGGRARILAEVIEPGDDDTGDIVLQALERTDGVRYLRAGYRRGGRLIRGPVSAPIEAWMGLLARGTAEPAIGSLTRRAKGASAASRRRA